jgi:curved DNA-binding protein CbpA
MSNDYYSRLGLKNESSVEDVKKAYRSLAMKCHPDLYNDEISKKRAEIQLKQINEAHETLADPDKKRSYDLKHFSPSPFGNVNVAFNGQPVDVSGFSSIDEIFRDTNTAINSIRNDILRELLRRQFYQSFGYSNSFTSFNELEKQMRRAEELRKKQAKETKDRMFGAYSEVRFDVEDGAVIEINSDRDLHFATYEATNEVQFRGHRKSSILYKKDRVILPHFNGDVILPSDLDLELKIKNTTTDEIHSTNNITGCIVHRGSLDVHDGEIFLTLDGDIGIKFEIPNNYFSKNIEHRLYVVDGMKRHKTSGDERIYARSKKKPARMFNMDLGENALLNVRHVNPMRFKEYFKFK